MVFDILTLFPEMFTGPFAQSIVKRARDKRLVEINLHNLRRWAVDKRGTVDDRPYGGGVGMILRIEPIYQALQKIKDQRSKTKIILLDPKGQKFNQDKAREYSKFDQLILICGHYEGVDERVREHLVNESVSIGDYVLTGGEIPAIVITDTVTRLIPGVLKKHEAIEIESFSGRPNNMNKTTPQSSCHNNLEYPQYTRPEVFNGWKVPRILLSGNHEEIRKWRQCQTQPQTS